jgi:hypothetical protein
MRSLRSPAVRSLRSPTLPRLGAQAERRQSRALRQLERGLLDGSDHRSITAVFSFLQNLYNFAGTEKAQVYRQHLLADTLLVPRLVLPYLNRCVAAANLLSRRAETYDALLAIKQGKERGESKDEAEDGMDNDAALALDDMPLVAGISAALRLLIIASFRAPPTRFVLGLLRRLNPTTSLLRASSFVARHDYLFALLCLLNVNMGALDLSSGNSKGGLEGLGGGEMDDEDDDGDSQLVEAYVSNSESPSTCLQPSNSSFVLVVSLARSLARRYYAHSLLHDMAHIHSQMTEEQQRKVMNRVLVSGALPIQRDCPSFAAVKSMLEGGATSGHVDYIGGKMGAMGVGGAGGGGGANPAMGLTMDEAAFRENLRAEAKQRSAAAAAAPGMGQVAESKEGEGEGEGAGEGGEGEEAKGDEEERARLKKEKKEKKKKEKRKKEKKAKKDMGLLGDLPSLEGMLTSKKHTPSKKEIMQLDLELPEKMKVSVRGGGG